MTDATQTGDWVERMLNSVPCGFLSFGDDGIILDANDTLHRSLELPDGSLIGQHFESILTLPSRIFYQTHFFPLLKMQGLAEEIYLSLKTAAAKELPVLLNAAKQERDGQVLYDCIFVVMRRRNEYEDQILRAKKALEDANREKDMANAQLELAKFALEKKQEELMLQNCELQTLRDRLEERVQQRTAELEALNKDLESFCYAVAHDLRTPLRGIVSTSEILKEEVWDTLSKDQRRLLERQALNGKKLATLIDDLLKFARLGLEGIEVGDVNLTQLAMDVVGKIYVPASQPRPDFTIQSGMRAVGDAILLRVALENLLNNAVKFSPDGGAILVGSEQRGAEEVYFVKDHGIGFDPIYASKIFEPFQKLHRDVEFEGSGVGLATVQKIIGRHGGRAWAESTEGEGSTFFFTLGKSGSSG